MNKDMKRICKKYDTKIASFQNSASTFSLEEECNFYQYNVLNNLFRVISVKAVEEKAELASIYQSEETMFQFLCFIFQTATTILKNNKDNLNPR